MMNGRRPGAMCQSRRRRSAEFKRDLNRPSGAISVELASETEVGWIDDMILFQSFSDEKLAGLRILGTFRAAYRALPQ